MAVKKKKIIVHKKKWYDIASPSIFNNVVVGEAYAEEPKKLVGKTVKVTADQLYNNRSFRNITVTLVVDSVKESRGLTKVSKVQLNESYVQRKARRNSKINLKKIIKAKTGEKIKISISSITSGRCNTSVKKNLRKKLEELTTKLENSGFDTIVTGFISHAFQKQWKKELHNIFPTISVELESLRIIVPKK